MPMLTRSRHDSSLAAIGVSSSLQYAELTFDVLSTIIYFQITCYITAVLSP